MVRKQQSHCGLNLLVLRPLCFCCADGSHGTAVETAQTAGSRERGNQIKMWVPAPNPLLSPPVSCSHGEPIQRTLLPWNTHLKPLLGNTTSTWTAKPDFVGIPLVGWEHQTQEVAANLCVVSVLSHPPPSKSPIQQSTLG